MTGRQHEGGSRLVAVSQRIDCVLEYGEKRDALDQRMVGWLAHAGFLSVPVPNGLVVGTRAEADPNLEDWIRALRPDAFLLSGGNDLGEFSDRDDTELSLLAFAEEAKVPVLGVCRGMQMMAQRGGSDLGPAAGHTATRHELMPVVEGVELPVEVNSYHNWAVETCPDQFEVVARSQDGGIEAIRHLDLPWEGWMWHPEREADFTSVDTRRLQSLFSRRA